VYLLIAALLGLLGRKKEVIAGMPPLVAGLCIVVVMAYLARLSVWGFVLGGPMGYMGLVLSNHAQFLGRRRETIRVRVVLAGFIVGLVMSMGSMMFVGVIDPWGWESISSRELPGVVLFGLAGVGMISMGLLYLWLSNIQLLPRCRYRQDPSPDTLMDPDGSVGRQK
jgi:hypothetical protein